MTAASPAKCSSRGGCREALNAMRHTHDAYLGVHQLYSLAILLQVQQLLLDAPECCPPFARPPALPVLFQCVCNILHSLQSSVQQWHDDQCTSVPSSLLIEEQEE